MSTKYARASFTPVARGSSVVTVIVMSTIPVLSGIFVELLRRRIIVGINAVPVSKTVKPLSIVIVTNLQESPVVYRTQEERE
jgi:hypothetical protein